MSENKEKYEQNRYDLGSGVFVSSNRKENTSPADIEDMKEQGFNSELDSQRIAEHRKKSHQDRYEFGQELLGPNPHRGFSSVRDIDVDGLGKKKTGVIFNFFKRD